MAPDGPTILSWSGENLDKVVEAVDTYLFSAASTASFEVPLKDGGFLIGEKTPQVKCNDPKAKDRHPTVIRIAKMSRALSGAISRESLRDQLRNMELPAKRGPSGSLTVTVAPPAAEGKDLKSAQAGSESVDALRRRFDAAVAEKECAEDKNRRFEEQNWQLSERNAGLQKRYRELNSQLDAAQKALGRARWLFLVVLGVVMAFSAVCFPLGFVSASGAVIIAGATAVVAGVGLYLTSDVSPSDRASRRGKL